jgi:hypothetical protein
MLKVSTRDRRAAVSVIDDVTGALLAGYTSVRHAARHCEVLFQVGAFAGRELSAERLNDLTCDDAEKLFQTRELGTLSSALSHLSAQRSRT